MYNAGMNDICISMILDHDACINDARMMYGPTKEISDSTAGVLIVTTCYERADFRVDTLSLWRKHLAFGPMFYSQKYRLKPTLL